MLRPSLMGALVAAALAWPAAAQDSYVVGVSGALTGPPAGTYAPPIEGCASMSIASTPAAASTARRST